MSASVDTRAISRFPFLNFMGMKVSRERQSYQDMPRVCDAILALGCLCLSNGHEGRKDTKGERTRREEGHKGRTDTKGGRTQRKSGHERRKDTKGGRT